MKRARFVTIAVVLGAALHGCGDGPDSNTPFNHPLGDGQGAAPTGTGKIDKGILNDPSAYQPANYDKINPIDTGSASGGSSSGSASAGSAGSGGSAGGEDAVLEVLEDLRVATLDGQISDMLDLFVDEKVQALRDGEFVDTAEDIHSGLTNLMEVMEAKTAGTDLDTGEEVDYEALVSIATAALRAQIADDTNAFVVLDLDALKSTVEGNRDALQAMMSAGPNLGGPGAGADAGGQIDLMLQQLDAAPMRQVPLIPMRNVDGEWRIDLPVTITDDQADAINEAGLAITDLLDQIVEQIETYDQISSAELQGMALGIGGQAMGTFQGQILPTMMPVIAEWQAEMAGGGGGDLEDAPAGTNAAPSFSDDLMAEILIDRCAYCHTPGARAFENGVPVDLSIENAYASLTTGVSARDGDLKFIVPGDPDASYFYQKMASDAPAHGRTMPIDGDMLDVQELMLFKAWIEAGAPDN